MEGVNNDYLGKHKKFRIDRTKLATAFFLSAFIVALIVFWWLKLVGITVTGEAFCGLEEHTHSSECYSVELICDFVDTSEVTTDTSAESETTDESSFSDELTITETTTLAPDESQTTETTTLVSHGHSEECYIKTLICKASEHIHSSECFPDHTADTETQSDWLSTFKDVSITDNISENLLDIATSQLGYAESKLNYEFDETGVKRGYTRYGEWYGNPYGNWNAMFVSFCLNYSHIHNSDSLISMSALTMKEKWETGLVYEEAVNHTVQKGELAFLDMDADENVDTVGIVTEIGDEVKIILGDNNDSVEIITLDEKKVIGYGVTARLICADTQETTTVAVTEPETTVSNEESATVTTSKAEEITQETTQEASTTYANEPTKQEAQTKVDDANADDDSSQYPWSLDRDSDEFKKEAVRYVEGLIEELPDISEFENKLNELEETEDFDIYEAYYSQVHKAVEKAYVNYENLLLELRENVSNKDKLFEYEWLYKGVATLAVTEYRTVEFVNNYDNGTGNKTVLIHSNNVGYYSSFGFYWWYAVVVDENEYGELIVTSKHGYEMTNKSSLKPTTEKGFVLLSHGDSNTFDCSVGDEVTVSFDYLNTAAGKNLDGYGTVTFSEYVAPEIETEEDLNWYEDTAEASDQQIDDGGGRITSADKKVITTKTINGTTEENVFDITLTVQTQMDIQTFLSEPDMAVVIVMDISNTMNAYYPKTQSTTTRYDAAVAAAENFMNQFAQETSGLSKIGFVAFNTHAHEILSLQPCTTNNVAALISEMKTDTKAIVSSSGYDDSHNRFTNVEGGLKRGYDMLKKSGNANQYIIFLSDGFPTTYLQDNSESSTNYNGYDPYTSSGTIGTDGVFYDYVQKRYCTYGTSYSDKASIKAREMATKIRNSDAKIFSIGIDVGGQTIQYYSDSTDTTTHKFSIVDRTSTTYEIGDATSDVAYKSWLGSSIGSNYYYDSEDTEDIQNAFNDIFREIRILNEQSTKTVWTATDPMPVYGEKSNIVGFVHFFDKDGSALVNPDDPESITGKHEENGENTAYHADNIVRWDLKKSGYTTTVSGNTTTYYYKLKYRVRLVNEESIFIENNVYQTNGDAYLEYRNIVTTDGVESVSDLKMVSFSKPAVHGYLAGFEFMKANELGVALPGAEFTLTHDDINCAECHGDNTAITDNGAHQSNYVNDHVVHPIGPYKAIADNNGTVSFSDIPSGHIYTMTETVVPLGYVAPSNSYSVEVAYDVLTVIETLPDGSIKIWTGKNNTVTNVMEVYLLPETGGAGTLHFTIIGIGLMAFPILYSIIRRKRERRFDIISQD